MKSLKTVDNSQLKKESAQSIYDKMISDYLNRPVKTLGEYELRKGIVIQLDLSDEESFSDNRDYYNWCKNYHNYYGIILSENKDLYRVAVKDSEYCTCVIHIKYENIKCVIGSLEMDCVNIGKERHEKEVVELINKVRNGLC